MNEPKIIPVVCSDAWERYGNKKALFRVAMNGKEFTRIGDILVHFNPLHIVLRIVPDLHGNLNTCEDIHLSQEAVDSIRPIQNQAEYDFVLTLPMNNLLFLENRTKFQKTRSQ